MMPVPSERLWSPYQLDVFALFTKQTGNGVVEAVAGSGKTTTIVEGATRWTKSFPGKRGLLCAFNKDIAESLAPRLPPGCGARTLHSLGYRAVLRSLKGCKVDDGKIHRYADTVASSLAETRHQIRDIASDLVQSYGFLKGTMTDLSPDPVAERLAEYSRELLLPALSLQGFKPLDKLMRADTTKVTFDEMLTFVIDHHLQMPRFDLVCVDEAQDLNAAQIEVLKRSLAEGGRLIAVGDRKQAIYRFRGATADALEHIKEAFSVPTENVLPLSVSYRCPRAIVRMAQEIVPHIEASETAPEGTAYEAEPGQYESTILGADENTLVVCRTNAPLVGAALKLIREGRKAVVRGRDIGASIAKLVRDLARRMDGDGITGLIYAAVAWEATETERLLFLKKYAQAQGVTDRVDTLVALCSGASSIEMVLDRIRSIFDDRSGGVVFSSIHRAKGLEAVKVIWLEPGIGQYFRDRAQERGDLAGVETEDCLAYVAITRAKNTLIIQPRPHRNTEE